MREKMKRVMIIDGNNSFLRNYVVDPSLSTNGDPIGGCKGFLKSLQKQCRIIKPDFVIVTWDGAGGSAKRKSMNKGYKDGRKPLRLNRTNSYLTEDQELQNRLWQHHRLIEYLNEFPIAQFVFDGIEADDVIAYCVRRLKGCEKVIVSADKDFFQLCDDSTILYRPIQNQFVNKNYILENFNIHPANFALARACAGDASDNIKGIPGAGLKTLAKRFPELAQEKEVFVDDMVSLSKNQDKKFKVHEAIIEYAETIRGNYDLMQLYVPMISPQVAKKIDWVLDECDADFSQMNIQKMMIKDGFGEYNFSLLYATMRKISLQKRQI